MHHNRSPQAVIAQLSSSRQDGTGTKTDTRLKRTEMDPQMDGQLLLDKAGKNIQWNKDSLFNKRCWENWTATCRKRNPHHFLTPYT